MTTKSSEERIILLVVADAIQTYAASMIIDTYGETRQYERDSHFKDQLYSLADHMKDLAEEHTTDG